MEDIIMRDTNTVGHLETNNHIQDKDMEELSERPTFDDLSEGSEVDVLVERRNGDIDRFVFESYQISEAYDHSYLPDEYKVLELYEEEEIEKDRDKYYRYILHVDTSYAYTKLVYRETKFRGSSDKRGNKIKSERMARKILKIIKRNRGRRYFSPHINTHIEISILGFRAKSNPEIVRGIFSNSNHPYMGFDCDAEDGAPIYSLITRETLPYVADLDYSKHPEQIAIDINIYIAHFLHSLNSYQQKVKKVVKFIFDLKANNLDKHHVFYPNNCDLILKAKKEYGICPAFCYELELLASIATQDEHLTNFIKEYKE